MLHIWSQAQQRRSSRRCFVKGGEGGVDGPCKQGTGGGLLSKSGCMEGEGEKAKPALSPLPPSLATSLVPLTVPHGPAKEQLTNNPEKIFKIPF